MTTAILPAALYEARCSDCRHADDAQHPLGVVNGRVLCGGCARYEIAAEADL
jgi:formylmethanofuran dehydrogenase subunit E